MKNCAVVIFILSCHLLPGVVFSQSTSLKATFENAPVADYKIVNGKNFVAAKNYYLLTLFDQVPGVSELLGKDQVLKEIASDKKEQLNRSIKNCGKDGLCFTNSLKFGDEEIQKVAARLQQLYSPTNALGMLVKHHLAQSGCYILFQNESPSDFLVKAWEQDARGINYAISVYGEGKKPNYPNIDSIDFKVKDTSTYYNSYLTLLYNTCSVIKLEEQRDNNFFSIPLAAALHFLELNEREQAADYEPMEEGENKLACEKLKSIKWDAYPYSVILIPGAGPDEYSMPLSSEAMLRLRLGAIQYHDKKAPFLVVSGGKVHPYKTKYCEAIEMKRFLVQNLGVPEPAVIIEPHARHTTTNMRNTVRLMYRYGFPMNKPGLTCTMKFQSNMIETTLVARCQKELNEVPYKVGKRLTETEVEFYPLLNALQINPSEPIDP